MSDKSFEQQVREELSDLRIKPNAAVWETVAASLKKEKKRRWILWISILATGLSGASVWWISQTENTHANISRVVQHSNQQNVGKPSLPSIPSGASSTEKISGNSTHQPAQVPLKDYTSVNEIIATSKILNNKSANSATLVEKEGGLNKQNNIADKTQEKLPSANQESKSFNGKVEITVNETITKQEDTKDSSGKDMIQETIKSDSAGNQFNNPLEESINTADSGLNKKNARKGFWQWRFGLNTGVSGIRNSLRSLLNKTNANAYDNAYMGNASPITLPPGSVGGSGSSGSSSPVVRDAFSFGTFLELSNTFGKQSQHSISFIGGYNLYTTKTGVGTTTNGTVRFSNVNARNESNRYYAIKDSASYTSNYHFLQVGIRYSHVLTWFKTVDMHWYGGLGANILIASNGLHLGYNGSGAYLFQNKSLLHTIQMDISGGIDIGLGKSKAVYVGPQVQYFLSNLSKQPGVNQHLFRPSLKMAINIGRLKK